KTRRGRIIRLNVFPYMAISAPQIFDTSGIFLKKDACVVIVRTEWNAAVLDKLEEGCRKVLQQHNAAIKVLTVPGAVEIPFAIKSYWENTQYKDCKPDAFI